MKLSTPRWWYSRSRRGTGGVVRLLLTPVGWIWAAVTARTLARNLFVKYCRSKVGGLRS